MIEHLIIGNGEVGSALAEVLSMRYGVVGWDRATDSEDDLARCQVLHLAYPYTPEFLDYARHYTTLTTPELIVVHSTVPVGTTEQLGERAVHSPVRGVHPRLLASLRCFVKFFGGPRAEEAAGPFERVGVDTFCAPESEVTEALKLWDTTQFGLMILIQKEIKAWCDRYGLDFDVVYRLANRTYNAGYEELGMPHVVRPWLEDVPGPIGGHCVIPNAHLLDHPLAHLLIDRNYDWTAAEVYGD